MLRIGEVLCMSLAYGLYYYFNITEQMKSNRRRVFNNKNLIRGSWRYVNELTCDVLIIHVPRVTHDQRLRLVLGISIFILLYAKTTTNIC